MIYNACNVIEQYNICCWREVQEEEKNEGKNILLLLARCVDVTQHEGDIVATDHDKQATLSKVWGLDLYIIPMGSLVRVITCINYCLR
jgi:hypothetical protein